jgi:hypothetical protein
MEEKRGERMGWGELNAQKHEGSTGQRYQGAKKV